MLKNISEGAAVWEQDIAIPTYGIGAPDKNPMFFEKRVYQGSSGRVYPHSVIDKIYDEKTDRVYRAVCLENKYLFVMLLPELGGRIQRALDKTNGYDFVYYNHVIKPALVGLNGPWISGGIEFNWPQHHRPSTFDPVQYLLRENGDGSRTVIVTEIENMFRTKGSACITLYPDRAYIEIKVRLYNRTDAPQTFLWWANPAVSVNDDTQSVFPPDVNAVMDHGKRDVSTFPIATGVYYKQDYSAGVDISRYKNIPVPTSYMAHSSKYDFIGGYDYGRGAGILHVADHRISPGKKQWTWGCGDFGRAWDRNLTDEDGPYIELMTGCFTDNQPDFSWLAPYEEKVFTQYFMPYKALGTVQNATTDAAVHLELEGGRLRAGVYATSERRDVRILVRAGKRVLTDTRTELSPELPYEEEFEAKDAAETECSIEVYDKDRLLVRYAPEKKDIQSIPEPARPAPEPKDCRTTEDLYLYGLHLEQYRHATFEPADYYLEGLRRDPTDIRLNNAYGRLLLRRGKFALALPYFEEAIKKQTRSNPNPYDGEPRFNLGLCLRYLDRMEEAYDAFFKATWNGAWQDGAFYQLSCIAARSGEYLRALEHVELSLVRNLHNMKARGLKTVLLRKTGQKEKARELARETLEIDLGELTARSELLLLDGKNSGQIVRLLGGNHNTCIELALDYGEAGMYREACELLESFGETAREPDGVYPMIYYHLAYFCGKQKDGQRSERFLKLAAGACGDYCFPHRQEDILALEYAIAHSPRDAKAPYYLGCLWYDRKQYEDAIACWEKAAGLDGGFPTVHRNLALAYFNKRGDAVRARKEMELAYSLDEKDDRVLMELDQLYKKQGVEAKARLEHLQAHMNTVLRRDELYLEYVTLKNFTGAYREAMELIDRRSFHPWEGGEGKVPAQYICCRVELAKQAIRERRFTEALSLLQQATVYPHNLGEGKLAGAQENSIHYYMGCAYEGLGEEQKAGEYFKAASKGLTEPAGMMYYNDQPPETIFYQGLALLKLGDGQGARSRFHKLISYGEKHFYDNVRIEYFAVSLPDLQIFEEDLNRKNKVHCLYMMGLGQLGLGNREQARRRLSEAAALDAAHLGVRLHTELL